jgi:hypothetical protein
MYALVATWKLDPTRAATHQADLEAHIVPLVRHQPGFVNGTWSCDLAAARTVSHVLFVTEHDARGFGDYLKAPGARRTAGAELESVLVAEVLAATGAGR